MMPEFSESDKKRFWDKVSIGRKNECWPWIASTDGRYGKFYIRKSPSLSTFSRANRVEIKAHRVAYFLAFGVDAAEKDVCHHCDKPPCCNPSHLFIGSRAENLADMILKNRRAWQGMKGEKNHRSKLSDNAIMRMREEYAEGRISTRRLAERYGIARSLASRIVSGAAWSHLPTIPLRFTSRKGMRRKKESSI